MHSIYGFDIIVNDRTVPLFREVAQRDWHRQRSYATRVNKKWRKRFGVIGSAPLIKHGTYIQAGRQLFMTSVTLKSLKESMAG